MQTYKTALLHKSTEGLRFLCVGAWATLLDLLIFTALSSFSGLDAPICFILSFYSSVFCRFFVDRRFTFKVRGYISIKGLSGELFRYVLSCTFTMLVGLGAFQASRWLGCPDTISKLISIPLVTIAGYLLFKFVVFHSKIPMRDDSI